MNAGTGEDSTNYFYNFPRNRLELWFLLESQRFYDPVFREFYKERDVVREERRMRVESSPQGQLVEALLATAFEAHPYRNMPGGWASDIENFRLTEAIAFYKKYYVPANITHRHCGRCGSRRNAGAWRTSIFRSCHPVRCPVVRAPLSRCRRARSAWRWNRRRSPSWRSPTSGRISIDKDDPVFDVLGEILAGERTGLLYTDLVRDKKIALGAAAEPIVPGRQISEPVSVLPGAESRPHRGGKREGLLSKSSSA